MDMQGYGTRALPFQNPSDTKGTKEKLCPQYIYIYLSNISNIYIHILYIQANSQRTGFP